MAEGSSIISEPLRKVADLLDRMTLDTESHQPISEKDCTDCVRLLEDLVSSCLGNGEVLRFVTSMTNLLETFRSKSNDLYRSEHKLKEKHLDKEKQLKSEIKKLKSEIEKLKQDIRELQEKTQDLESMLQNQSLILVVCEMPFSIETMIVKAVLGEGDTGIYKIKDMVEELEHDELDDEIFATKEEKDSAIAVWKNLRTTLEWEKNERRYKRNMKTVKDCRFGIAHPPMLKPDDMKKELEKLKEIKNNDQVFKDKMTAFDKCLALFEQVYNLTHY